MDESCFRNIEEVDGTIWIRKSSKFKTMDSIGMKDIEELTFCNICKQKFNHSESIPKLLPCRHYFCLSCVKSRMTKQNGVICMYCWKKTDINECDPITLPTYSAILALADNFSTMKITNENGRLSNGSGSPDIKKNDTCQLHAMPLSLWCQTCLVSACRACTSQLENAHHGHQITSQMEVTEKLALEIQSESTSISNLISEINRLMSSRRSYLLKILEACVTVKTHIETEVQNGMSSTMAEIEDARSVVIKTQACLPQIESVNEAHNLYANLAVEKQKLQLKCQGLYEQYHVDYIVKNTPNILDVGMMRHVLDNLMVLEPSLIKQLTAGNPSQANNPLLLLINYCIWQLCNKSQHHHHQQLKTTSSTTNNNNNNNNHATISSSSSMTSSILLNQQQALSHPQNEYIHQNGGLDYVVGNVSPPTLVTAPTYAAVSETISSGGGGGNINSSMPTGSSVNSGQSSHTMTLPQRTSSTPGIAGPATSMRSPFPVFYFNVDVNGSPLGRILIETRPDIAPKMFKNFATLTTGELGYGYKGCNIFQCWEGESIITGDFEVNNGRGGRSIYDEAYFIPDDTKFPAKRGAVGMRRTQKKHDSLGMVGSQFRIILQEMRGFTAIFGHVVEGIELVEKIASFGDQAGKPSKSIVIVNCGKLA